MSKLLATLPDGKVCDFIDQKIRNDTPEEYVRQNIERRLVLELGYLPEQIEVEYPIKQGSKTVRVDLAIFRAGAQHNQENVWVIIECKKDSVPPSASKDGVEQRLGLIWLLVTTQNGGCGQTVRKKLFYAELERRKELSMKSLMIFLLKTVILKKSIAQLVTR